MAKRLLVIQYLCPTRLENVSKKIMVKKETILSMLDTVTI